MLSGLYLNLGDLILFGGVREIAKAIYLRMSFILIFVLTFSSHHPYHPENLRSRKWEHATPGYESGDMASEGVRDFSGGQSPRGRIYYEP